MTRPAINRTLLQSIAMDRGRALILADYAINSPARVDSDRSGGRDAHEEDEGECLVGEAREALANLLMLLTITHVFYFLLVNRPLAFFMLFFFACKKGRVSVNLQEYKVWDATTRVFHWLNVLCVLGLVAVGTVILNADALGVNNDGKIILKTTHVWIGYVFVLNLLWRLVWGFIGGPYARWRTILPVGRGYGTQLAGEFAAIREGRSQNYIGHTPLGRIAVTVLLGALLLQGATGLILAGTDLYMPPFGKAIATSIAVSGLDPSQVKPYAPETVDPDTYQAMRDMRAPIAETHLTMYFVLLGLVALHIFAVVLTELKHGGNIISAMFSGRKSFAIPPTDRPE